ncbi:MAG: DUF86 domain-containing protein [Phycisphaerae bacterium]
MPPRDWRMRIEDILDAIGRIQDYTRGMTFEAFSHDRKTIDAVVRNITVIGEAAGNVPSPVAEQHGEIPWRQMRDFRNVVVHTYFGVDLKVLWDTVRVDLPPLVDPLRRLLSEEK